MAADTNAPNGLHRLKRYVLKNFEQVFVLLILLSVSGITYFLPYKLAFLNFFYIPILLAAAYLGTRQAVLGATLSLILVTIYAVLYPDAFSVGLTMMDLYAQIGAWGSFLVLSGAVVGRLNHQLKEKIYEAAMLDNKLTGQKALLEKTMEELVAHTEDLEAKVKERTETLEKSKRAVEEHKDRVEEALYSTMDADVVKLMIEKRLRTEKRRISVLFCDIKNFTEYAERHQPEVVISELNTFVAAMEETLMEYRAHIDKYMGDAIMAEFGAPMNYERHGLLAVAAGLKIQERMARGNFPWPVRIGIASGDSIVGMIGNKRQSYTALGDVVNLASRIEELSEPGAVTVDEETSKEVSPFFELRRKTVLSTCRNERNTLAPEITETLSALDDAPRDLALLKKAGQLMLQSGDAVRACDYLRQALAADPHDPEAKMAYADAALQAEHASDVPIRGRAHPIHLFEVTALKDPLRDTSRVPQHVYDQYAATISKSVNYPEDILLPVECMDGSIGHSRLVGFLAGAMAIQIDLPEKDRQDIIEAGYLANIGKTIVPHQVLNRKGNLTGEEMASIEAIRRESVRKLRTMGYTSPALFDIIMNVHENFDGSGPLHRAGSEIHLGARIIRVADAYCALTSWRPYRERWDARGALHEISNSARRGKFDLRIVAILTDVLGLKESSEMVG